MTERLRVVVIGLGVVGKSLCRILSNEDSGVDVVAVADSKSSVAEHRGLDLKKVLLRKERTGLVGARRSQASVETILDSEFDALVELTPANPESAEPGLSHINSAMSAGRHVVTSSKMPLALHFSDLKRKARSRGVLLRYGACVGGGIPILEFGDACAKAEPVNGIEGVLNATSNFILSEMQEGGKELGRALQQARSLGYAEADPRLDLDGIDAAAKIVILANHVLGTEFVLKNVTPIEGITEHSKSRLERRQNRGGRMRSLAICDKKPQVRIVEIPADDPLCVRGAWNAVRFRCADSGERVVSGPSGGGATTARAVLRDLLNVKSHRELN